MEVDPDYVGFVVDPEEGLQEERSRNLEENAREAAVEKMRSIINEQFNKEIQIKESELMTTNQRLADARCAMDRLRACVVASFYAASFTKPVDGAKGPDPGAAYHPAIQNVMRKAVTAVLSKNAPSYKQQQPKRNDAKNTQNQDAEQENENDVSMNVTQSDDKGIATPKPEVGNQTEAKKNDEKTTPAEKKKTKPNLGGRHRIKKTIIVGNVSKYIPSEQREGSDRSTHKWMVYVRGSKEEPRIDHFVRKVWFFLHPSYRPNDLVEVCEAPFHLTRRGWGEFPVRVQIHFCDRRNRPVDIIHGLRLDRTYTGLQTLGAETVCEVELDRSSVQLSVDEMLDVADLPDLQLDTPNDPEESTTNATRSENKPAATIIGDPKKEDSATEDVDAENTNGENVHDEVDYSDQNRFQSVTTSCTISSDTVSPTRKRKADDGDDQSTSPTVEQTTNEQNIQGAASTEQDSVDEEDDPTEDGDVAVRQKRKRKRRKDSYRTSASEDEILSDSNASVLPGKRQVELLEHRLTCYSLNIYLMPLWDINKGIAKANTDQVVSSESIAMSRTLEDSSHKSEDPEMEVTSESDLKSPDVLKQNVSSDSKFSSSSFDVSSNMKQSVVILPPSAVLGGGCFRMRSASDGDGFPSGSCASLIKSGVTVTPVLNVKLQTDQQSNSENTSTSTSIIKKVTMSTPKKLILQSKPTSSKSSQPPQSIILSPISTMKPGTFQSTSDSQKQTLVTKKENQDSTSTHITIPLSSLLKTSTTSPQIFKLAQPLSKGSTFSVNMLNLASPVTAKPREKRSFSADQSSARALSLTPVNVNMNIKSGSKQKQPIQLHIISPTNKQGTSPKGGEAFAKQPTFALRTLQAALSSSNLTIAQPSQKKLTIQSDAAMESTKMDSIGHQQYVFATVVNPKGKQQFALINPSTLTLGGSKKLITIASPKGQKPALGALKQATLSKISVTKSGKGTENRKPNQQEHNPTPAKPEPVYKAIGDQILLHGGLRSLIDDILPLVVKRVPLVDEKRELAWFPFCAQTEADFLDWNIGKQRASEWQRAALLRKILEYIQTKSEVLKTCQLPSKRFILNWCLRHGHSVFTDEFEEEDEASQDEDDKMKEKSEMSDIPTTMTTTEEMLKLLESKMEEKAGNGKTLNDEDDDVIFVDVVTVETPENKEVKQEPMENIEGIAGEETGVNKKTLEKIQLIAESPEVAAVEEITRKIGVNLHRMNGTPTCHIVLAKALQQFTESLLRKSVCSLLARRDGTSLQRVAPEEISVLDVATAIRETSAFDFLTDKNTASNT